MIIVGDLVRYNRSWIRMGDFKIGKEVGVDENGRRITRKSKFRKRRKNKIMRVVEVVEDPYAADNCPLRLVKLDTGKLISTGWLTFHRRPGKKSWREKKTEDHKQKRGRVLRP